MPQHYAATTQRNARTPAVRERKARSGKGSSPPTRKPSCLTRPSCLCLDCNEKSIVKERRWYLLTAKPWCWERGGLRARSESVEGRGTSSLAATFNARWDYLGRSGNKQEDGGPLPAQDEPVLLVVEIGAHQSSSADRVTSRVYWQAHVPPACRLSQPSEVRGWRHRDPRELHKVAARLDRCPWDVEESRWGSAVGADP